MTRFFFDVVRANTCLHDFTGRYLRSLDEARDVAETVSLDLACAEDNGATPEIQVRDSGGLLLFAMKACPAEAVLS
jgi:hypothetical protein